jgi:prenyltransferase/squalene oxidase-like repeat protein
VKTLDWVLSQQQKDGAFLGWADGPAYPEITGYIIPTLLQWGEIDAANRAADWLVSVQNADGSFNSFDGDPYVFDTGACYEGLTAAGQLDAAQRAKDWIEQTNFLEPYNVRVAGLVGRRDTNTLHPERTESYRTHYWAYALEGLYLLGLHDLVYQELLKLPRGLQPYTLDGNGNDTCATAQIAKLRLLLQMDASAEVNVLRSLVNSDGSLPHDLTNKKKVLWACKYFLDTEYLLKQSDYDERWHKVKEWQFQHCNIDIVGWDRPHPFGISGCFRVRNDHEFLYEAVTSHLPYLDEAVIALQPSDEQTETVVARLEKLDKVRVVRYPVAPTFITDPEWPDVPENSIRSFVYLSNWALSQCKYSWIARIEADVICLSSFRQVVERVRNEPDKNILYGRVILNVAGRGRDQISATVPRNGGWDECVFPNHPAYRFTRKPKYEVLANPFESECMGWSALHLKRCKRHKIGWNNESYVPFDRENVAKALRDFNAVNAYPGPDNPEGEPCLFELS